MTPTYEELLQGATTWRFDKCGITYTLSHHGYRGNPARYCDPFDYENHPGTWCFYLVVREQSFPHRWGDFALTRSDAGFEQHPSLFDDLPFHGGVSWASTEPYFDRESAKHWQAVKIGCDYNHLWDREACFPDTFNSVKCDAERAVDAFLEQNPDHWIPSRRSGQWGPKSDMLEMENGAYLHPDDIESMSPEYLNSGWKLKGDDT